MSDTVSNQSSSPEHNLRGGVLGLFDSVIMGIAGSAPAYSIAATTTALFGTVAFGGPAALLYCGIPMFGIVFAFSYLSRHDQSAGASYSWVRRALHPVLGYLSGWAVFVSALIFMVIATFPAGSSVLSLFSDSLASSQGWITIFGCIFFLLMVGAVAAGVTVTVKVQIIMSCVEIFFLALFAALAIFNTPHVANFQWSWFSPSIFHEAGGSGFSMATFTGGALLAAFYYWGWDVTANLNEETKDAKRTSGLGGILGALVVFTLFEVFTVASNLVLTPAQLTDESNAADILQVLGQAVWHGWGGKLIVVSVLLSTVATLETTLIQVTRTLFVMGRDHTLPRALGTVHKDRKSPIMSAGYSAIGLQICFYYSLAGLSVVILYRRQIFKSASNFIFIGLWPLVGSVFMGYVFVKVIPGLDNTTLWVGLGAMALGLIPMFYYWFVVKAPYFKMAAKADRHVVIEELEELEANL